MITEVSIRYQKNPEVGIRRIPAYTPQYTTAYNAWVCMLLRLGLDFVAAISTVNSGVNFADSGRSVYACITPMHNALIKS